MNTGVTELFEGGKPSVLCKQDRKSADAKFWWNKLHGIVVRCYCKSSPRYHDYGGRGIGICRDWYDTKTGRHNAIAFRDWCLSNGWRPDLQIDRIDNDGDYAPENCRFVTAHENTRNRRNTWKIDICDITHCLKDWCEIAGANYNGVLNRCQNGAIPIVALILDCGHRFRVGTDFHTKGHS